MNLTLSETPKTGFVVSRPIYKYMYKEVIKLFSCSTQLSTKFQVLIETKITDK